MRIVCAADIGNENIQLVTSTKKIIMKNKIDEGRSIDINLTKGNNTFNVEFRENNYVVGDYAEQASRKMEGKNTEKHLIGLLTSFSTTIESGAEIEIVIGESLNAYFNKEHKESIKKNFIGEHKILINGKEYLYFIKDIHILPESIGHKLLNYQQYMNNKVSYTIDMGSSTINYGYYEGLIPIESKSSAYTLGMHNIISNISKSFSRNGGPTNCSNQQVKEYIEYGCKNLKLHKIIETEINRQFEKLESMLEADGVKISDLDELEFCGGVALTLRKYIENRYSNAIIVDDPLWSNVKGYFKFAQQKFNR